MAYRHRLVATVRYGHFNDVVGAFNTLNEISSQRGWIRSRVLAPFVGETNLIVVERDYPDLNTYESEMNEFFSDPEAMKVWRSAADFIIEGSSRDELWTDAPTLA